jgi:site-specific DNA-methyltransferase (adenine-specific)
MKLYKGDCLEVMKQIPDGSVDAIITDPPFGTTSCKWDSVINFDLMWEQLNRIIKPNGAIVLFGSEPFSSALRMSNIKNYKYDWIWDKEIGSGGLNAKRMPLKQHEIISVFSKNNNVIKYIPIKTEPTNKNFFNERGEGTFGKGGLYSNTKTSKKINKLKNPTSIIKVNKFSKECNSANRLHPTQKPILLMEYLISTYTNEGETVLDFTMGSGSTGVAAKNTNRNFIGIEMDENYFNIAKNRIND